MRRRLQFALILLSLPLIQGLECTSPQTPSTTPPSADITRTMPEDPCVCINPGGEVTFEISGYHTGLTWSGHPALDGITTDNTGPITFPEKGVFTITASARGPGGPDSEEIKVIVRDNCEPLAVAIAAPADESRHDRGQLIQFQSSVSGGDSPYTYEWDFTGSGSPESTLENPSYAYAEAGTYQVTLTVIDAVGDSRTVAIEVVILVPFAELTTGRKTLNITSPDEVKLIEGSPFGIATPFAVTIAHGNGVQLFDVAGETIISSTFDSDGTPRLGALALTSNETSKSHVSALLRYGSASSLAYFTSGAWEQFQQSVDGASTITDAVSYGNASQTDGFVTVTANDIAFREWLQSNGTYEFVEEVTRNTIDPFNFNGIVTAQVNSAGTSFLAVLGGSPGVLYQHDRSANPGVSIGVLEDDPRKIRCESGVCVVTNFGSDSITIATWDGASSASIIGNQAVGDGPVGVDLMLLSDGNVAALTTGFNDDTYTVTIISPVGSVVSSTTTALPGTASQPGHGIWARDTNDYAIISAFGSNDLYVVDPGVSP